MKCASCERENRQDANYCNACGRELAALIIDDGGTSGKTGPLDGIRVIDWTAYQFGPVSTMMLADLGAEVIKVESPEGEPGRRTTRISQLPSQLPAGVSAYFESLNRQKKSIALDLKNPKGVEVMCRLAAKSDVLVQNFRQGVAERLGLGYEDVVKHNPKIVYASATGYGPKGPDSRKPAFALTGEARSGSLWWGGPDDGLPYNLLSIADQMAGIMLSYGILGALVARERIGIGQKVDASHLGGMMWLGGNRYGMALITKNAPLRQTRTSARNPLWNYYRCKDGRWIALSMNQTDRYLPLFCKAIGRPHFAEDERFNNTAALLEHSKELIEILDDIFVTKTQGEWVKVLSEAEGIIWERVQDVFDLPDDPQVIANNYIVDFDHPVLGPSKWLQTPVGYSRTPLSTRKMAPSLGEDTAEVLIDTVGYVRDDVAKLRDEGVIL